MAMATAAAGLVGPKRILIASSEAHQCGCWSSTKPSPLIGQKLCKNVQDMMTSNIEKRCLGTGMMRVFSGAVLIFHPLA